MPATYNGIGTHYYGKRNVESRKGACHSCGRETTLTSYNTRLWFVVVFIPIIPLGQKRIIDYCSLCTRHYVVDLKKWETAKQLEISAALDQYRTTPTHENAVAVHRQLLKFHQTAQADEFQKEMLQKFPDQAIVHCYLGSTFEHRGLVSQAEPFFAKAHELRPDLPEGRIGVAMKAIREARLPQAVALLDFLDKPGSAQLYSLEPLEILGNALQKTGEHESALRMYERILLELPQVGQHKGFRKSVTQSEKALRRTTSILPKSKFSWRRFLGAERGRSAPSGPVVTKKGLMVAGGAVAVIAVIFIAANTHIRTHRKVFFVNGLSEVESVVVDGNQKLSLRPNRPQEVMLAEGAHTARVTTPIDKTVNFDIKAASYFSRWFSDPAWIVNPDASACLLYQEATYAKIPQPPRNRFLFGQGSYHMRDVSHPFTALPDSVTVSSSSEERTLQHIEVVTHPIAAFYHLRNEKHTAEAMQMAETRLRIVPNDQELLQAYLQELKTEKDAERGRKLLEPGLSVRPVLTEWHRAYQDLSRREHNKELLALYDSYLEKDATNATLLYLRGRAEADDVKASEYYARAIAIDPKNAFAHYALAYRFWNSGDWVRAKPLLAKAYSIRPEDESFRAMYNLCQMATGDFATLEKDLRDQLAKNPMDLRSAMYLEELYATQSRRMDAETVTRTFLAAARKQEPRNAAALETFLRGHFLYASGEFAELEKLTSRDLSPVGRANLFQALLEQGKIADAEQVRVLDARREQDGFELLSFSLASRLAGDAARAQKYSDLALKELQAGLEDLRVAAETLASEQAPTDAQFAALRIPQENKALVAAVLRFKHPSESARFNEIAKRLNVERTFPYHLVQKSAASQ